MIALLGLWSHAGAAVLFGALTIWLVRLGMADPQWRPMAAACGATAVWTLLAAMQGAGASGAMLAETFRSIAWLGFMYNLWRMGGGGQHILSVGALYIVLALAGSSVLAVDLLPMVFAIGPDQLTSVFYASIVQRMIVGIGALVLVHNLYTAATPDSRGQLRLPLIGLGVIWAYDIGLYTVSYLSAAWSQELLALRGIVAMATVPVFALAAFQTPRIAIRLSRSARFQTASLGIIAAYLSVMVIVVSLLSAFAGVHARAAQVAFVFAMSVAALALLPSRKFRAWFRVKLSKHLFQHRYDYRAEWLRFTDTIGRPGEQGIPLDTRIIKAVADITESPAGMLFVPSDDGGLMLQAHWNWPHGEVPAVALSAGAAAYFSQSGRIVALDALRDSATPDEDEARAVPEWVVAEQQAWALVPLIHFDRLAGIVMLARPDIDRTLDWEDLDLLRVVGRQAASYLSEARGQEILADIKQFDEFNRRFAFIMHDIKNLVSQLSLVSRNAERHIGNPAFQADMLATLKSSVARMNELLARLSQHNKAKAEDPRPVRITPILERVAAARQSEHPVVIGGDLTAQALTDPARLEQALSHLVQNAIDASGPTEPVSVIVRADRDDVVIEVEDKGAGMSSHFIRHNLFKPFASTKQGGFGVGAYEARALILAMQGRIDVFSREGEGTKFRITLPLAREPAAQPGEERARAA
jgi:putative PEP-CTERM system histidine kinase